MADTRDQTIPITHELADVRARRAHPLRRPRMRVHERPDGVEFSLRTPDGRADGAVVCLDDTLCELAVPARGGGSWYASFLLPSSVAGDAATATLSDGELTLWIPRRPG